MPELHADPLLRFEWPVYRGGYQWIESKWGLALTPRDDQPREPRRYRPFAKRHTGLFQVFAALEPDQDAVLSFANEYGMLGRPLSRPRDDLQVTTSPELEAFAVRHGIDGILGERYLEVEGFDRSPDVDINHCWTGQIALMSGLLGLSERDMDPSKASTDDLERVLGPLTVAQRGTIERLRYDGTGTVLTMQVNRALGETCAYALEWSPDRQKPFRLDWTPRSLLGALWLQVAYSLTQEKTFRVCARTGCDRPIEISRDPTTGARADAKFCSDACRSRHYRERKRRARQLAGRGWSEARIAEKLGTETQTVLGWLKKK